MKLNNKIVPHTLLSLFIIVTIGTRLINMDAEMMNLCIALAGLLCFGFSVFWGNTRLMTFSVKLCLFLSLLMAISIIYNGNARIVNLLWVWAYMGAALLLYEFGLDLRVATVLFYTSSLFFVYQAITGSVEVDEILNVGSQNNISTLCIFMMIVYYFTELRNRKKEQMSFLPAIVVLFVSIWTASRAALLTMAFFFLFVVLYNFINNKISFRNVVFVAIVVTVVPFIYVNYFQDFGGGIMSKLDRYGVESERTIIWAEYMEGVGNSFGNFLFGVKGTDPQYSHLSYHEGNTHNAFLMLHAKFGIMGFILVLSLLFKSFIKTVKTKNFALLALLFVVMIRSIFDWTAFPGLLDVIFYFYILFSYDKSYCKLYK